jgi:SNF2 family DNA or RNA helicase
VFKLVTLGTLEEKISAIIENKRKLMADIVREDDPGLLKSFNRQELLAFLS